MSKGLERYNQEQLQNIGDKYITPQHYYKTAPDAELRIVS
jgi:hypothetical protein